jgi:hypothetical protein
VISWERVKREYIEAGIFPKRVPNRQQPWGDQKTQIGFRRQIPASHCRVRLTLSRLHDFQSGDFCLTQSRVSCRSFLIRSRNQKIPAPL